jgi:hypothetical protein
MGHGNESYRISTNGRGCRTGADRACFSSGVLPRDQAVGHRVLEHGEAAETGSRSDPCDKQSTIWQTTSIRERTSAWQVKGSLRRPVPVGSKAYHGLVRLRAGIFSKPTPILGLAATSVADNHQGRRSTLCGSAGPKHALRRLPHLQASAGTIRAGAMGLLSPTDGEHRGAEVGAGYWGERTCRSFE